MITVRVTRNAGLKEGEPVIDSLIGDSIPAALERGRVECDKGSGWLSCTYAVPYRQLTPGRVIRILPDDGESFLARVTGYEVSYTMPELMMTLYAERLAA